MDPGLRRSPTVAHTDAASATVGLVVGAIGSVLVNFVSVDSGAGPVSLSASVVIAIAAVIFAITLPTVSLWMVATAVLFPVALAPYTLTVTVLAGFYAGVVWRILRKPDRVRSLLGLPTVATFVLGLALLAAATGSVLLGNSIVPDGGSKAARVFVFVMAIVVAIPIISANNSRAITGLGSFLIGAGVGMSLWGLFEFPGRLGLVGISAPYWAIDPLGKAIPGAVSAGFVGGGPNTYAVFLACGLVLLAARLDQFRGRVFWLAIAGSLVITVNLALTFSRGGQLAAIIALLWLVWRWRDTKARPWLLAVVGSVCVTALAAYAGAGLLAPRIADTVVGGYWRVYVADRDTRVEQELTVSSLRPPTALWLKIRAAPGSNYLVEIAVEGVVVLLGKNELPYAEMRWMEVPLPNGLLEGKEKVTVSCRLVGEGNRHDQYFEIEGRPDVVPGVTSHFLHGSTVFSLDLSPDPGTQAGTYQIQFSPPDDVSLETSSPLSSPKPSLPVTPGQPTGQLGSPPAAASPTATRPPSATQVAAVPRQTAAEELDRGSFLIGAENDRWILWRVAVLSFVQRPLFGAGFQSGPDVLRGAVPGIDYRNIHNQFLEFLSGSGIVGFVAFAAFMAAFGLAAAKHSKSQPLHKQGAVLALEAILVGLGVALIFGSFLVDSRIAGLLWLVASMIAWRRASSNVRGAEPTPAAKVASVVES